MHQSYPDFCSCSQPPHWGGVFPPSSGGRSLCSLSLRQSVPLRGANPRALLTPGLSAQLGKGLPSFLHGVRERQRAEAGIGPRGVVPPPPRATPDDPPCPLPTGRPLYLQRSHSRHHALLHASAGAHGTTPCCMLRSCRWSPSESTCIFCRDRGLGDMSSGKGRHSRHHTLLHGEELHHWLSPESTCVFCRDRGLEGMSSGKGRHSCCRRKGLAPGHHHHHDQQEPHCHHQPLHR